MCKPGWNEAVQIGSICNTRFVIRIRCPPLISREVINVQASINPKILLIVLSQQFCLVTRAISNVTRKLKLVENWPDVLSRIIKALFLAYCDRGIVQFGDIEWMGQYSNPYNEEVINFTFWVFLKNLSLTRRIFGPIINVGLQQQKCTNKASYDNSHPEKLLQVW